MDKLILANSWASGGKGGGVTGAKLSIRVASLMLEGATFDGQRLAASSHDSPTHATMPTCSLAWVPAQEKQTVVGSIALPLYFSSDRDKVVANLDVPCSGGGSDGQEEIWLLAGSVLFINSYI